MPSRITANCSRRGCIALAAEDSVYCTVHRWFAGVERVLGVVAPVRPVTDRIEYDDARMPVRFYPRTR